MGFNLPGGGGTFYYEDSQYLDCDSSNDNNGNTFNGQVMYLNPCWQNQYNNASYASGSFAPFYANSSGSDGSQWQRLALTGHARMLASNAGATCQTHPLDLRYSTNPQAVTGQPCSDPNTCCGRLALDDGTCNDGPTVLASNMCDLIRAMGGLPGVSFNQPTSSARRHSAPEYGTRSARRLLQSMLPALPLDYSGTQYDPNTHLRLNCRTTDSANCAVCDPTLAQPAGASNKMCPDNIDSECGELEQCVAGVCKRLCAPVPLATVFISDEEDFSFKDDCQAQQSLADKQQLPETCTNNPSGGCDVTYCSQFMTGLPAGYDPDQAAITDDGFYTGQWRSSNAAECSSTASDATITCANDPCPQLTQAQCTGTGAPYSYCTWTLGACFNRCAAYTSGTIGNSSDATAQYTACTSDSFCRWDQSQVSRGDQTTACVMNTPRNDCQACKRYMRNIETVNGTVGSSPLVGFGSTGPVYAIVRNKGEPGSGTETGQPAAGTDTCAGGYVTWGRGDGQGYRDAAINTLGRTQDVCAQSYQSFMQLIISDLAVLSKPYPLSGSPIAATLKVGISRLVNGTVTYIPVQRSHTQGFIYDPTSNSIGFKSDPASNSATDVAAALHQPFIPQSGDLIYISYRLWEPVPCNGTCDVDTTCARTVCTSTSSAYTCSATSPCPLGYTCNGGSCSCSIGDLVDICVASPACGACETYDPNSKTCQTVANQCACNTSGQQACNPSGANVCPIGYACDETCVCSAIPTCQGAVFNSDDTVSCAGGNCCAAALNCCTGFASDAATCAATTDKTTCQGLNTCSWVGTSGPCEYRYATCCPTGETARCYSDPESGQNQIYCQASGCTCACGPGFDCDVANNCACFVNGG